MQTYVRILRNKTIRHSMTLSLSWSRSEWSEKDKSTYNSNTRKCPIDICNENTRRDIYSGRSQKKLGRADDTWIEYCRWAEIKTKEEIRTLPPKNKKKKT